MATQYALVESKKCFRLFRCVGLLLSKSVELGTGWATQTGQANHGGHYGNCTADQQRVVRIVSSGNQSEQQGCQSCSTGLPQKAGGAEHSTGSTAAIARGRGDNCTVVRGLEQSESATAKSHAPNNIAGSSIGVQHAEQKESTCEDGESDSSQQSCVDPLSKNAG